MVKSLFHVDIPAVPVHALLLAQLAKHGDNIALVDGSDGRTFTFNQVEECSRKVGSALNRMGAKKGDLMAIYCTNCPEYSIMYLACLRIGVIVSGANPNYKSYEMNHHLSDSKATYVLGMDTNISLLRETARKYQTVKKFITLRRSPGCVPFADLMADDGEGLPDVSFDPKHDVAIVPYSSGTTGLPKGVMLTHYNMVASIFQVASKGGEKSAEAESPYDVIVLSVIPAFHSYGLMVIMTVMLLAGAQVITLPRFHPEQYLATIEKYKVTRLSLVPPLVIFLAKTPLVAKYDVTSVKAAHCGAAAMSKETERAFQERFNVDGMKQGYGMTEVTSAATGMVLNKHKPGSSGVLVANTEGIVVDVETKKVLGPGQEGELWIRGPQVMKGYLNNPEATRNTVDKNGWLHTGDLGYYDEEEFFFITGRLKELIKYKGFQIAPAELESLLLQHPGVGEVAVIGIPDHQAGELPRAFIVRNQGVNVTEAEIYNFVKDKVINYKWLRGGVQFVSEIPRTSSGKIIRREVAKLMPPSLSKL